MTVSDQTARPADAPPPGPEWVTFPDARDYQASHRGKIRSFKRNPGGLLMKLRDDADEYLRFNYTDDDRVRHHNFSVARAVLLAHDPRPDAAELHACHGPGGKHDNRWPENIYWGTPDQNRLEALETRLANSPPKPKPPKTCPRCGAEHWERGKNCEACFVGLGVDAATGLMADPYSLRELSDRLEYPPHGLLNLAMRYGGLRLIREDELNAMLRAASHRESRLRRVLFRREASRQNSDAR